MANSGSNGGAGTPFGGKLRVEGIQTVVPTKPTDPRQSSRIIVSQNLSSTAVLQRRFHVLLCYNKASDDDSGWLVAGRIKDSLGRALQEQPLLAGRLRRREESGDDLEIVSNDSGVRLVEAKAEMGLGGFVEMKEKRKAEAELLFWEDVLDLNPQFSPLFYVTNFKCGGYSIGISCSLLLVDPFLLTTFIKKWANAHNNIISRNESPKIPTFFLPNHGKPTSSPSLLMGSNTTKDVGESVIFNIPTKILDLDKIHKNLAALCVDEAERDAGRKLASNLSLFLKVPSEDDKVEVCTRQGLLDGPKSCLGMNGMSRARTWDELELDEICFGEGNKSVYASCWINSVVDEGSVMIVPSTDDLGVKIVVTFT
ncbi:hypothetical protein C2S51_003071 [Perilla frutescens var. frutescens]|nr:hypothetical protein C2S51_003071 [Perilla frutescens var. frutescens]